MADHNGDDLEDDFIIDDTVALSEGEGEDTVSLAVGDGDDITKLLSADEDEEGAAAESSQQALITERKRKRRAKEKERKVKKQKLAESVQAPEPALIGAQPPVMLADYLSAMQAKSFSKMSAIELQDRQIPVVPTLHTRLSQRTKASGAPTLLFLTGAALRVADVTRTLRSKQLRGEKGGEVAKLFAKHFKLEEHVKYLKRTKVGCAVGTPGRIGKLLCETDALAISALTHIVLDVSYRDKKNRSLLDIPETRDEVFRTVLGAPQVLQAIRAGKIQIVLF
ncbi:hypothetical protein EWM64_g2044 [Hericium alpestre]|uniref:U3-containing 90S pre-ribosomal complex subunit-domain containing protein n=1 Tax=Hericium alpestre TaxID=135208 RepID=A0A4Z0A6R6_9AGAM|nr:hypothetical protein EWM64_g2044 [Hericium alpestre]